MNILRSDRFDRLAGIYVFCMDYHNGQNSRLYSLMCKIQKHYKLRLSDTAIRAIQGAKNVNEFALEDLFGAHLVYCELVYREKHSL